MRESPFHAVFDGNIADICATMQQVAQNGAAFEFSPLVEGHDSLLMQRYIKLVDGLRASADSVARSAKFREFISFISIHFIFEAKMMRVEGYPGSDHHEIQHADFIKRVNGFVAEIGSGAATVEELVLYIGHWLLGHTLISDNAFGDFQAELKEKPEQGC